jgi:hypothetical protein
VSLLSQPRSSGPPTPHARTSLLTSHKDVRPRRHARPTPALPAAPMGSLRGRGWWRAAVLEPLASVPEPLEVMADRAGEEADGDKVVADGGRGSGRRRGRGGSSKVGAARARSGDDARWRGARAAGSGSGEVATE